MGKQLQPRRQYRVFLHEPGSRYKEGPDGDIIMYSDGNRITMKLIKDFVTRLVTLVRKPNLYFLLFVREVKNTYSLLVRVSNKNKPEMLDFHP